jgi:hypothetical protein
MKMNEDRKSCVKALEECGLREQILEQRINDREEKIANLLAVEDRLKDNAIAYQTTINAGNTRIQELEKKNKGLKIKGRLTGLAAIILPLLVLVL